MSLESRVLISVGKEYGNAGPDLCRRGVKRLSKSLTAHVVLEEVWCRIEVETSRQIACQAADIADFQDVLPRQFALDGEVNHVTATDFEVRVVLEAQQFAVDKIWNYG